jgi:hypothetical protein
MRTFALAFAATIVACRSHRVARTDAGDNALFDRLFGAQDPMLPGKSCRPQRDECRGSSRLFVCTNMRCGTCSSDTDCANEYPYLNDQFADYIVCQTDGTCGLAGQPIGTCGGTVPGAVACRIANFTWFPCVDGQCAACTDSSECMATYGPTWICSSFQPDSKGDCRESVPPPVDAGVE